MIQEQQPAVKTVIRPEIHKLGRENENIVNAIASHNEGMRRFTMQDLEGYCAVRNAILPQNRNLVLKNEWPVSHVSEDGGKTFTLSLTWNVIPENVTAADPDDIKNIHFK